MKDKQKKGWILGLVIAVIIVLAPMIYQSMPTITGGNDVEKVRTKIEKDLYQKYGEEFVVDRIGTRTALDEKFYQARIYPKSIIGTPRERDKYYYGNASVDILSFGRLDGVADDYGVIKMNEEAEKYLSPKVEELFGKRLLLKTDIKYKELEDGSYIRYLESGFKDKLKEVKNNSETRRMEVELYIYIFDRIEDKVEKEERRKEIFDFVQYLKKESLFKYLEMGVIFIDERVLAASYSEFKREIYYADTVKKYIEGKTVYLPPTELRNKMSKELQKEIDDMSEEELLANMRKIRKSTLSYDGIREYNGQYQSWIYSIGMLEEKYSSSITEEDRNRKYDKVSDVELDRYKKYIYIN